MKKPNILFLLADDERFDTIHALGNDEIITPNLDKLVEQGTSYTNAHIQGGTCGAVCMPSRAMLNTGRSLFNLQGKGQEIPMDHALLGEVLKQNGYETFGTGKWHNGKKAFNRSFSCGDSIFFGGMHDHWMVPFNHYDPTCAYEKKMKKTLDFNLHNSAPEFTADYMRPGEHSTDVIAESIKTFLGQKHDKPFFAYAAFLAPHDPRTMPQEFRDMYDETKIKLPPNFANYHNVEYANTNCRDELLAPYPRTEENTKLQIAEYYAMISHVDYQIGEIVNKLEESGERENTIIIYAADNGLALGQHGLFGKQNVYDHSVRVPLVISGKGINKNQRRNQLVYLYDIFPTLCDILGLEIPKSVQGISFAKSLNDPSYVTRDHLYYAYTDKIRGVTKNNFKYMEHRFNGLHTKALFNLKDDPYEIANLYLHKDYQDVLKDLQATMKQESIDSNELNQELGKTYWNN